MHQRRVLIFGGSGQDGSLLAFYLLSNESYANSQIYVSATSLTETNLFRLRHLEILDKVHLFKFDMLCDDPSSIVQESDPDQVYILSGLTNTADSITSISLTAGVNVFGFSRILESLKKYSPETSIFVAGSSEMYGNGPISTSAVTLDSNNTCIPTNPYGLSKLYQYHLVNQYRSFYSLDISYGILFNHESELRGRQFVTKKIVRNMTRFKYDSCHTFSLGNLSSARDWSSARDFVQAFEMLVDLRANSSYIFASGTLTTVREFLSLTAECLAINCHFEGSGLDELLICDTTGRCIASVSPRYYRTNDTKSLYGDPSRLTSEFCWKPTQSLISLINHMVKYEDQFYNS